MPMNHRMTRDDDADQTAGNPLGQPDRRQYDNCVDGGHDALVDYLKKLMNKDRQDHPDASRQNGTWWG